jgi:hypothetical protein
MQDILSGVLAGFFGLAEFLEEVGVDEGEEDDGNHSGEKRGQEAEIDRSDYETSVVAEAERITRR